MFGKGVVEGVILECEVLVERRDLVDNSEGDQQNAVPFVSPSRAGKEVV